MTFMILQGTAKKKNINNYKIMDEYFLDDPLFKNIDPRKKAHYFMLV